MSLLPSVEVGKGLKRFFNQIEKFIDTKTIKAIVPPKTISVTNILAIIEDEKL